jgi:hypothetical protein
LKNEGRVVKKVIVGSSALVGVAAISAVIWWYLPKYEANQHAVSIAKSKPPSIDLTPIENTVTHLRDRIDADTGFAQMDLLSSGDSYGWSLPLQDGELVQGPNELESEIGKCVAPDDVKKKLQADVSNLKRLYEVAAQEHNAKDYKDGAQALKYYHRVTEDMNFYITNQGEHYEVSHILGGYQTVESFINAHLDH